MALYTLTSLHERATQPVDKSGQPLAMVGEPAPLVPDIKLMSTVDYSKVRSVSQLGTFAGCGEAYRLEKVARAPRSPAAWFVQGTAFHSAVEAWELSGRELPDHEVIDIFHVEYDSGITEEMAREPDLNNWLTGGRTKAETDIRNREEKGADQVAGYLAYSRAAVEVPWTWGDQPAVEVPFQIDFDGLVIIGYIDLLLRWPDGQVSVRDLKTGTKRPAWPFQLGVYALAVEEMTGYRPRWGDYYIAKDNRPDGLVNLDRFDRKLVSRWFHNLNRGIEAQAFVPNPGDGCRTCGVQPFCQAIDGDRAFRFAS